MLEGWNRTSSHIGKRDQASHVSLHGLESKSSKLTPPALSLTSSVFVAQEGEETNIPRVDDLPSQGEHEFGLVGPFGPRQSPSFPWHLLMGCVAPSRAPARCLLGHGL